MTTSVVGSHARPGWLDLAVAAQGRGELGPNDIREVQDDAVDAALRDQEDAGIDVVSDGEMRRAGFFTAEFYRHLTGVEPLPSDRRLGAGGHDQQHRFRVLEAIASPDGLGVVEEFRYARTRTTRPIKVTLPGPFTLSGRLTYGPGQVYPDRIAAARAFVPILAAEVERLVAAGATYIQIDEPSPAIHPEASAEFAALFNDVRGGRAGSRAAGGAPLLRQLHGPAAGRAGLSAGAGAGARVPGRRAGARMGQPRDGGAGRRADVAAAGRDLGAGVVDVKSYHIESADEVAARIERILDAGVPAERLLLVPDCGFSQTARWATRPKLQALVAGRDLVLGGRDGGAVSPRGGRGSATPRWLMACVTCRAAARPRRPRDERVAVAPVPRHDAATLHEPGTLPGVEQGLADREPPRARGRVPIASAGATVQSKPPGRLAGGSPIQSARPPAARVAASAPRSLPTMRLGRRLGSPRPRHRAPRRAAAASPGSARGDAQDACAVRATWPAPGIGHRSGSGSAPERTLRWSSSSVPSSVEAGASPTPSAASASSHAARGSPSARGPGMSMPPARVRGRHAGPPAPGRGMAASR